jgi:hypothetical protein
MDPATEQETVPGAADKPKRPDVQKVLGFLKLPRSPGVLVRHRSLMRWWL